MSCVKTSSLRVKIHSSISPAERYGLKISNSYLEMFGIEKKISFRLEIVGWLGSALAPAMTPGLAL